MENSITITEKSWKSRASYSNDLKKSSTEIDILRKAYEIYLESSHSSSGELASILSTIGELKAADNYGEPVVSEGRSAKRLIQL